MHNLLYDSGVAKKWLDLGNVWYLGTPFLSQYYAVFDASSLKSQNKLQMGIGLKNPDS